MRDAELSRREEAFQRARRPIVAKPLGRTRDVSLGAVTGTRPVAQFDRDATPSVGFLLESEDVRIRSGIRDRRRRVGDDLREIRLRET